MANFYHHGRLVGDEDATVSYIMQNGLAKDFLLDFFMNILPYEAVMEELAAGDFCGQTQEKLVRDGLYYIDSFDVIIFGFAGASRFPGYFDRKGKRKFTPLFKFKKEAKR